MGTTLALTKRKEGGNAREKPLRTEYVSFRVTLEEKEKILTEAFRLGQSPSTYCRLRCLKIKVTDMSEATKKERRVFINMANNWNQIARRFNTDGANPQTVAALEEFLADIQRQKKQL